MYEQKSAFISYKSEEANAAYFVRDHLIRNGISVWMAPDSIPASSSYPDEIYNGIKSCDAFVLMLSERAQISNWVINELTTAINLHKPIFPFLIENCVLKGGMNIMISNIQMITAYNNMEKAADRLVQNIKKLGSASSGRSSFESHSEKAPSISEKKAHSSDFQTVRYSNGTYRGELSNGKKHGFGTMTFKSGNVYEGDWKNDVISGKGKYTFASGHIYEGEFSSGKRNGTGKMTYPNGNVYEGEWKDNDRHGYGTIAFTNGEYYEGNWKDNQYCGQGKYTFPSGNIYEGQFENGKYHGQGKYTYHSNGSVYIGEWKENDRCSKGVLTYGSHDLYKEYEGEFRNDKRNGHGRITYHNGAVFEGEFADGMRNGAGEIRFPDGTVVKGEWENDRFVSPAGIVDPDVLLEAQIKRMNNS